MKLSSAGLILVSLITTLIGSASLSSAPARCEHPWKRKADELILPLIEKKELNNLVVGVIDNRGNRHLHTYGERPEALPSLGGDTLFEIGSITKVFTALLLADAVVNGELNLSDPVRQFLPDVQNFPKRGQREITLEDLATHTSGLPRIPSNLVRSLFIDPLSRNDPYSQYDEKLLYEALAQVSLEPSETPTVQYSNLGAGLLGLVLCKRLGKAYEALVLERLAKPLGMSSSKITLDARDKKILIPGFDQSGKSAGNWHFQTTFAGAGALRSSAGDMLTFLLAHAGRTATPLQKAIDLALSPRHKMGKSLEIGLGWFSPVPKKPGSRFWWHNGGTGGYSSFAAFSKSPQVGVVVLSNRFAVQLTDKIGMELIHSLTTPSP